MAKQNRLSKQKFMRRTYSQPQRKQSRKTIYGEEALTIAKQAAAKAKEADMQMQKAAVLFRQAGSIIQEAMDKLDYVREVLKKENVKPDVGAMSEALEWDYSVLYHAWEELTGPLSILKELKYVHDGYIAEVAPLEKL